MREAPKTIHHKDLRAFRGSKPLGAVQPREGDGLPVPILSRTHQAWDRAPGTSSCASHRANLVQSSRIRCRLDKLTESSQSRFDSIMQGSHQAMLDRSGFMQIDGHNKLRGLKRS